MPKLRDVDGARELVRENLDLVEVVESYGYEFVPIADDNVACSCPFHEETEPSFAVSVSKQLYTCYGCQEGGDVFSFIQKMEGMGHVEAIRHLADFASVSIAEFESELTKEDKLRAKFFNANEKTAENRQKKTIAKAFKSWLADRLLDKQVLDHYGVGYSADLPPQTEVSDTLGLDRRNQWVGAVVVPLRDGSGRVAGFRNRMFDGPKTMGPRNDHPLTLPEVYGFSEAKRAIKEASGVALLVEGEVDVWQMVAHGFDNTLGTFGTSFGADGLEFLAERGVREVVVIPDGDKAGRKFARRIASLHSQRVRVKIAHLASGDPDEILCRDGAEEIASAIGSAVYGMEYLVDEALQRPLTSGTDKIDLLLDLKPIVAEAPKVEQEIAVNRLAEELNLDPAAISDVFLDVDPGEAQLHDRRAERTVLANMLADAEFSGTAVQELGADDFHMGRHAQIFSAIALLYRQGHEITVDTVGITLERNKHESALKVLDSLAKVGTTMGADFLIGQIRDKSMRRQMVAIGRGLLSDASNPTIDPELIAQAQMSHIANVVVGEDRGRSIDTLVDTVVTTMHDRMENPSLIIGHDLGDDWQSLNRTIHGLQNGRLMVLAAPSGVGKSSAMAGMMSGIAVDQNVPTLCLTLEMDDRTLASRLVAHRSEVKLEQIATGHLSKEDVALVHGASAQLAASPLRIIQRGRTLEEAQAIIRHDRMVRGTEVVFLDYVQLMGLSDAGRMRRDVELGKVSEGLLQIALELDIAVVALAQINREGAKAHTKADHTNIAEAFKIAQDADIFVTLMEKSVEEIEADGAELGNRKCKISKNRRDGKVGVAWHMHAQLDIQRIKEAIS